MQNEQQGALPLEDTAETPANETDVPATETDAPAKESAEDIAKRLNMNFGRLMGLLTTGALAGDTDGMGADEALASLVAGTFASKLRDALERQRREPHQSAVTTALAFLLMQRPGNSVRITLQDFQTTPEKFGLHFEEIDDEDGGGFRITLVQHPDDSLN